MWLWWCGNVCLIKDDALLHGKFIYHGLWYNLRNRQPGRRHEFERSASLQGWVLCYFYIRRGDMHGNMLIFRLVCRSYSWRGAETLVIKIKDKPSFFCIWYNQVLERSVISKDIYCFRIIIAFDLNKEFMTNHFSGEAWTHW